MSKTEKEEDELKNELEKAQKLIRNLETEKQLLDAERLRLEQEVQSLRNEIDRLREPPLLAAIIIYVDEEARRAVIKTSHGYIFEVSISRKIAIQDLKIKTFVAVNSRTFAIMKILHIKIEDYTEVNKLLYFGTPKGNLDDLMKK